jgi:hypothetical protein
MKKPKHWKPICDKCGFFNKKARGMYKCHVRGGCPCFEKKPKKEELVSLQRHITQFMMFEMSRKEQRQAVTIAATADLSLTFTSEEQTLLAKYCLWARQRLSAIESICSDVKV